MLEEGEIDTFDFNEENTACWLVVTSFKVVFHSGEICHL